MVKFTATFFLLILIAQSLNGAENNTISLDDEVQQELTKIRVNTTDKIEIRLLSEGFIANQYITPAKKHFIVFKDLIIPFPFSSEENNSQTHAEMLLKLLMAAGNFPVFEKLKQYYQKLFPDSIEPGHPTGNLSSAEQRDIIQKFKNSIQPAIEKFNQLIASDEIARKNVETQYKALHLSKIYEYISEKRRDRSKERNAFLYILGSAGSSLQKPANTPHSGAETAIGIRFNYFFLPPMKSSNWGIMTNISYLRVSGEGYKVNSNVFASYLNIDIMLTFLFSSKQNISNLLLAFGFSGTIKLKGLYSYNIPLGDNYRYEFPVFIPSIAFEIGYQLISKNQSFSLFFSLFIKAGFTAAGSYFLNNILQDESKKYYSIGIRFGLGFNLHKL